MKKSRPLSVMALLALSAAVCQAQSEERVDTLATSVVTAYHSGGTLSRGQDLRTEIINSAGLMKMACCNLGESFENSAAVTVGYADAATGARQIRLLGMSGIYTQMLDESRPVLQGLLDSQFWILHLVDSLRASE